MDHEEYWYWLLSMETFGLAAVEKLLRRYGTPEGAWEADPGLLTAGQQEEFRRKKAHPDEIRRAYEAMRKMGARMITAEDPEYPERLRSIYEAPYGLFVRGSLPDPEQVSVGIVGARKATTHGRWFAEKIGGELAGHGIAVISGMAEGIDSCAHSGALEAGGLTYAILGCGIDEVYPRAHARLHSEIIQHGGVISEYAPGTPGLSFHFPYRNRIISGLSDLVLVVEARQKSGSLITVERALEQGREVMAVPGRPDDPLSEGCNRLIREGAGCCTCVEDVLAQLEILSPLSRLSGGTGGSRPECGTERIDGRSGAVPAVAGEPLKAAGTEERGAVGAEDRGAGWEDRNTNVQDRRKGPKSSGLTELERKILTCLGADPMHVDRIAAQTGLRVPTVLGTLMDLELRGCIRATSAGTYQLAPLR